MTSVVYTATFDENDDLQPARVASQGARYVCFTDCHEAEDGWEMVQPERHCQTGRAEQQRCKILAHEYFPDADFSVWCCWGATLLASAEEAAGWLPDDRHLAVARHPYRDCAYAEALAAVTAGKETAANAARLAEFLTSSGYPRHNGLAATTVLIRRHTSETECFNALWWDLSNRYSMRDQLTFDYVSWKLQMPYFVLPWELANSPHWLWRPHA
jgi:hypothetical protein